MQSITTMDAFNQVIQSNEPVIIKFRSRLVP